MTEQLDRHFDALVVVSPSACGGEEKNQDRARWFPASQVASLGDGVTSSPRAAEAAQLAVDLSPTLFMGNTSERLGGLCDLLLTHRLEELNDPLALPRGGSPQMHEMLAEVARDCMASAFQTTLVAAAFATAGDASVVDLVRCGDSAFFAFSPAGDLLGASPSWERAPEPVPPAQQAELEHIRFGPGDEILVKVLGRASDAALLAGLGPLDLWSPDRWLVCQPLDGCDRSAAPERPDAGSRTHWLNQRDRLVVPAFQLGYVGEPCRRTYRQLLYSSVIRLRRCSGEAPARLTFDGKGSVTEVLPDHYNAGRWVHHQDRFPPDTHFILASDGFYSAFETPGELWAWLECDRLVLDADDRNALMLSLHRQLHAKRSDDDMSFIWVHPCQPADNRRADPERDDGSM